MQLKIHNFKELLNHLTKDHDITANLNLWTYGEPKQTIHVKYSQIQHIFSDDMIHLWDTKPLSFTDIHGVTHEFNTTNQNRIRNLFIYDYLIKGNEINTKTRGFKQLLQHIESTHVVVLSFMLQIINNRPLKKRISDTFFHFKVLLVNIQREFDYDMFFDISTRRDLAFKQINNRRFKTSRYRVRNFKMKNITIRPNQSLQKDSTD